MHRRKAHASIAARLAAFEGIGGDAAEGELSPKQRRAIEDRELRLREASEAALAEATAELERTKASLAIQRKRTRELQVELGEHRDDAAGLRAQLATKEAEVATLSQQLEASILQGMERHKRGSNTKNK